MSFALRQTITCTVCQQQNVTEEPSSIIHLPAAKSIQWPLQSFLKSAEVNNYFCNFCNMHQQAILDNTLSKVGKYLIDHLKRFGQTEDTVIKDIQKVFCTQVLQVPLVDRWRNYL